MNLKLNTIAGNKSGQANNDDQVRFGGGVALFEFTGQLSMVGNIIAENTNRLAAVPSDFEVGSSTAMVPALDFTVKRGQRNNIKDWTIITSDPQKLNLDAGLFGEDPELAALAPLDLAGRGLPFPNLPTRLPGMTINVHGSYVPPDALDRFFAIPPADQRGFVRPRLDLTTPGSVDPDRQRRDHRPMPGRARRMRHGEAGWLGAFAAALRRQARSRPVTDLVGFPLSP